MSFLLVNDLSKQILGTMSPLVPNTTVNSFNSTELRVYSQKHHGSEEDEDPEVRQRQEQQGFGENVEAKFKAGDAEIGVINGHAVHETEMGKVNEDG